MPVGLFDFAPYTDERVTAEPGDVLGHLQRRRHRGAQRRRRGVRRGAPGGRLDAHATASRRPTFSRETRRRAVQAFAAGAPQHDDVTALVVKYTSPSGWQLRQHARVADLRLIDSLIFDWNQAPRRRPPRDAGRRDAAGRAAVAVGAHADHRAEDRILHLIDALGIDTADIGSAGRRAARRRGRRAAGARDRRAKLKVKANCAARTHVNDIQPIADVVQRTGLPIECCTFIGSSPIRQYTEGWTLDWLLRTPRTPSPSR
jgi:hypothetical protein